MAPQNPDEPISPNYQPLPNNVAQGGYGTSQAAYPEQVNGGLILAVGIIGIMFLQFVLGPIAWAMGHKAVNAIKAGRANPAEMNNAVAGKICGIVGSVIGVFVLIALIIYLIFLGTMTHAMFSLANQMSTPEVGTSSRADGKVAGPHNSAYAAPQKKKSSTAIAHPGTAGSASANSPR